MFLREQGLSWLNPLRCVIFVEKMGNLETTFLLTVTLLIKCDVIFSKLFSSSLSCWSPLRICFISGEEALKGCGEECSSMLFCRVSSWVCGKKGTEESLRIRRGMFEQSFIQFFVRLGHGFW